MGIIDIFRKKTAANTRSYDAAQINYMTGDMPHGSNTSADSELLDQLPIMHTRAHDAARNSAIAVRLATASVARIIGHGHTPECADQDWMDIWERWAKTPYAHNRLTFGGVQTLIERTRYISGECWIQRVWVDDPTLPLPFLLRLIEPDQVDLQKSQDLPDGRIVQGVEYDLIGRWRGTWILPTHPGDSWFGGSMSSVFVPASDLAHRYTEDRPGQTHGVPETATVIRAMAAFERYLGYEIARKGGESSTVAVVTGGDAATSDDEDEDRRVAPKSSVVSDAFGRLVESWRPRQILYAPDGREIRFHAPASIGGFAEFAKQIIHWIAAGKSLPYYAVSGDLSQTTYSSARIGDVETRMWVKPMQTHELTPQVLDVVARWVTEAAIMTDQLPGAVSDYRVTWTPPAVEEHNREDAAKADAAEERFGYASHSDQVRKRGRNPGRTLQAIADDLQAQEDQGVVLDTNAKLTTSWLSSGQRPELQKQSE